MLWKTQGSELESKPMSLELESLFIWKTLESKSESHAIKTGIRNGIIKVGGTLEFESESKSALLESGSDPKLGTGIL